MRQTVSHTLEPRITGMTTYLIIGIEDGTPVGPIRKTIHEHAGVKTDIVVNHESSNVYGIDTRTDYNLLESVVARHMAEARAMAAERRASLTQYQREFEDRRAARRARIKDLEESRRLRHADVDAEVNGIIQKIQKASREDIRKHGRGDQMRRDFQAPAGYKRVEPDYRADVEADERKFTSSPENRTSLAAFIAASRDDMRATDA